MKENTLKIIEPKKYHIIFNKELTMENLAKVLNEIGYICANEKVADKFKKLKLKGIKIIKK